MEDDLELVSASTEPSAGSSQVLIAGFPRVRVNEHGDVEETIRCCKAMVQRILVSVALTISYGFMSSGSDGIQTLKTFAGQRSCCCDSLKFDFFRPTVVGLAPRRSPHLSMTR